MLDKSGSQSVSWTCICHIKMAKELPHCSCYWNRCPRAVMSLIATNPGSSLPWSVYASDILQAEELELILRKVMAEMMRD